MTYPKPSQAPEQPNNFCLTNTDSFFTVRDGALHCLPFGRLSDIGGSLNKASSWSQCELCSCLQPLFKATQPSCSSPEDTCEHIQNIKLLQCPRVSPLNRRDLDLGEQRRKERMVWGSVCYALATFCLELKRKRHPFLPLFSPCSAETFTRMDRKPLSSASNSP